MIRLAAALILAAFFSAMAQAGDWLHWRGPTQNGVSTEKLPDSFELTTVGKNNLLWKQPFGGRAAPLVMNGKMYFINGFDTNKATEGERVVCLDAETGKFEWDFRFSVFHTDIVSSRLGWTSMTADPKAGTVFAHTTAGFLLALDAKTGKKLWERQLTEEFGRVTGYGGRIASPIYDEGLVILGLVNSSWGDQSRGNGRFVAFDSSTGEVVWWSSPTESLNQPNIQFNGTYYSNPVITVVNGQRLMVSGAADGCVHGLNVRTGKRVWSHYFSKGVINPSPVVDGNFVYVCHGEENPLISTLGRVVCLDMSVVKDGKPKVVWDNKNLARRFGLASPSLANGRLYIPEDGGELFCFDTKTGKQLWKTKFGTVARGAPLICDGKLYIFAVLGNLTVIKLGNKEPDHDDDVVEYRFKPRSGVGQLETNGTPIAVNGKLYIQTLDDTYCIGATGTTEGAATKLAEETTFDAKAEPVSIQLFPYEVTAKPGSTVKFQVNYLDANGRKLPAPAGAKVEWSLPLPPKSPTGAQPPALNGKVESGEVTLEKVPSQHGLVEAKVGTLTARARVRVAPLLPLKQDFSKVPVGAAPSGWVNAAAKFEVLEVDVNGKKEKVLSKVNNNPRPPVARSMAFMTMPDSTNYTIQADMAGSEVNGKLPDMGVVANRYLLVLDGKNDPEKQTRQLRLVSWEARNRVNQAVTFNWNKDTWYTVKFSVDVADGKATIKGKVWERGKDEPAEWTINYTDPAPNISGAAALYGYISNVTDSDKGIVPGSTVYYQNVSVTPNAKK